LSDKDRDQFLLFQLRSLNDSAIRGYYSYELLKRLLLSQEKSFWEEISIPLEIVASVVTIFMLIQNPGSYAVVGLAYGIAIVIVVGGPIAAKRRREREGLDDCTYLGIFFDEVAKYANEIELANRFDSSLPTVRAFMIDTAAALKKSVERARRRIERLRTNGQYPSCLGKLGRNEDWVRSLDLRAKSILQGEGFL
jgi:hypothetical protein